MAIGGALSAPFADDADKSAFKKLFTLAKGDDFWVGELQALPGCDTEPDSTLLMSEVASPPRSGVVGLLVLSCESDDAVKSAFKASFMVVAIPALNAVGSLPPRMQPSTYPWRLGN